MGLFDNMIKKGLSDALGGALGDKVADALEQATGIDIGGDGQRGNNPFGSSDQGTPAPGQWQSQQASGFEQVERVTDRAYFRDIIQSNFSGYIIREDVPASDLGGEGGPYDFGLFASGECAGVIKLVGHNRTNNRAYKGAKATAEQAGVPFINFFTHMPNEYNFVVGRITRLAKPLV